MELLQELLEAKRKSKRKSKSKDKPAPIIPNTPIIPDEPILGEVKHILYNVVLVFSVNNNKMTFETRLHANDQRDAIMTAQRMLKNALNKGANAGYSPVSNNATIVARPTTRDEYFDRYEKRSD